MPHRYEIRRRPQQLWWDVIHRGTGQVIGGADRYSDALDIAARYDAIVAGEAVGSDAL